MITGWATDTYNVYNPLSWWSKILCLVIKLLFLNKLNNVQFAVIVGLAQFALLIDYIHGMMIANDV